MYNENTYVLKKRCVLKMTRQKWKLQSEVNTRIIYNVLARLMPCLCRYRIRLMHHALKLLPLSEYSSDALVILHRFLS